MTQSPSPGASRRNVLSFGAVAAAGTLVAPAAVGHHRHLQRPRLGPWAGSRVLRRHRTCENLLRLATGPDHLIHEVIDLDWARSSGDMPASITSRNPRPTVSGPAGPGVVTPEEFT